MNKKNKMPEKMSNKNLIKRKRGRPKGSKNKNTLERDKELSINNLLDTAEKNIQKKKRGRPKGSKNKKTLEKEVQEKAQKLDLLEEEETGEAGTGIKNEHALNEETNVKKLKFLGHCKKCDKMITSGDLEDKRSIKKGKYKCGSCGYIGSIKRLLTESEIKNKKDNEERDNSRDYFGNHNNNISCSVSMSQHDRDLHDILNKNIMRNGYLAID